MFDSVEAMFQNFDRKPPFDSWDKSILRDYCEGLKTAPWDSPTWENVRNRMNAICANCRP